MTLQTEQGRDQGESQLYLDITITDAIHGNPRFLLGAQRFSVTNVPTGDWTQPAVVSWGQFVSAQGDAVDLSTGQIAIDSNATLIPVGSTTSKTFSAWMREMQWREAEVLVYQWNGNSTTQELIWRGYILGVTDSRLVGANYISELMLTSVQRDLETVNVSDLITKASFASAPFSSLNKMVPIPYGRADALLSATDIGGGLGRVGFPMNGFRGIVVDEGSQSNVLSCGTTNLSTTVTSAALFDAVFVGDAVSGTGIPAGTVVTAKASSSSLTISAASTAATGTYNLTFTHQAAVRVRFGKNDGVAAWYSVAQGTPGDAGSYGCLWIYDDASGLYGMVDAGSYQIINDTGKMEVVVQTTPTVYFFMRPKQVGSKNATGFTDSYKIIDSDPNNYVESTATDYTWSFYIPAVAFSGRVKTVGVVADFINAQGAKNRQVTIGIWDIYNSGGAAFLNSGAKVKQPTKLAGDPRIIVQQDTAAFRYDSSDFLNHIGTDTNGEMASGQFVTRNTADAIQATLEATVRVEELGGGHSGREGVRLYNVGVVVEVDYTPPVRVANASPGPGKYDADEWELIRKMMFEQYHAIAKMEKAWAIDQARERVVGTNFFVRGTAQKDDGSGTYTGSAGGRVEKICDVANHIITRSGQTVNDTAASLGNFVDPRSYGYLKDINIMVPMGPQVVKRREAIEILSGKRYPATLRRARNGEWNILADDLNPHSSTVYRSTSEVLEISPNDIVRGSFVDREIDSSAFVNSIVLNYSHGYGGRESAAKVTYENSLSQKWFAKKTTDPFEYPEIQQSDLSAAADAGPTALAQWLGRRTARPRRIIQCQLTQKYYDLEAGHSIGFGNLQDIGIPVQAFRAGLLDFQFNSSAGGTDYADSAAAVLISLTDSAALFGLSQQTDRLSFSIQTAAGFTSVANAWRFSSGGGAFTNLTGVTNTNALKLTGAQTVTWTKPNWWTWVKDELTLGGTTYGPCYWIYFAYTAPTIAGLANARTEYPAIWPGRYFRVLNAIRKGGRRGSDYPFKDATLLEVA